MTDPVGNYVTGDSPFSSSRVPWFTDEVTAHPVDFALACLNGLAEQPPGGCMGVVRRALSSERNQRVAAKRLMWSPMDWTRISDALDLLVTSRNLASDDEVAQRRNEGGSRLARWAASVDTPSQRHYERFDEWTVVFGFSADYMRRRGFNANSRGWIATLGSGEIDGGTALSVTLYRWAVDDGGNISNGHAYVDLVEEFALKVNARYNTERLFDPDDFRFTHGV